MIKFVVARYEKDGFENFLGQSLEQYKFPSQYITNEEASSIYQKYNLGIERWKNVGLEDEDILVFCHADVKILDEHFEEKLNYAFQKNPNLAVAGIIGSKTLDEQGGWWLTSVENHKGHLIQWTDENEGNKYDLNRGEGNHFDMCVLDGLCLFVRGSYAKNNRFDEETFVNSYNFYDYDYCLMALENKMNVGVLDILLEHKSAGYGIYEHDWISNKDKFIQKWKNKGYVFPLKVK